MADIRHVQAAPGRRVLDPGTMKPIPSAGNADKASLAVDMERPFWFRRLIDEDVIVVDPDTGAPTVDAPAETVITGSGSASASPTRSSKASGPASADQPSAQE